MYSVSLAGSGDLVMDNFKTVMRKKGLKITPQRIAVLEEIIKDKGHRPITIGAFFGDVPMSSWFTQEVNGELKVVKYCHWK